MARVVFWTCTFAVCRAAPASARSLADQLSLLINDNSFFFQGANLDALTPTLERIAVLGTSLPATSTVPGVTYTFDPELGVPVRSSGSLGPAFLERGDTVGRHLLLVGMSYAYADLSNLDGQGAASRLFFVNSAPAFDADLGESVRVENRFTFREFALRAHEASVSATYGLTDRWDANALLPLVETQLDVNATSRNVEKRLDGTLIRRDRPLRVETHGDAFGPGDLLLRTKYRLPRLMGCSLAAGLVLRVPTGAERDFHGIGDWTVEPLLVLSREIGRHDVHASLGPELDADKIQRSRIRYGLGLTLQPADRIAALFDLLGSSGVAADDFRQDGLAPPGARFDGPFQQATAVAASDGTVHFFSTIPRSDILDIAIGLKLNPIDRGVAFVTAIVPLTKDGLRADVIPAVGIEYVF